MLFYPIYNGMPFVDASLAMSQTNQLLWTFDYGFKEYGDVWETAYGYIPDSIGTGAMVFVFFAGICVAYRNRLGAR
ncbi:MAG: hypothetical protein Q8O41_02160 [Candidatus Methanoperedens sp.]|nr:hypothetical protein [Candidatus Methanoperedens sp.]